MRPPLSPNSIDSLCLSGSPNIHSTPFVLPLSERSYRHFRFPAQSSMRFCSLALLPFLPLLPSLLLAFEHVPENDLAKICRPVNRPLDLLFLLDGSGSVGGNTFQTQMQLLNKLVDILDIGAEPEQSQLGVMQYATYTFVEFPFNANKNKTQTRAAIQRIRHKSGTTKSGKALEKAFQLFRDNFSGSRKDNVAQVVIIVHDGHGVDDPIPAAARLRQSGVNLIALGIGTRINMGELIQITGNPELAFENLTLAESEEKFTDTFRRLATSEKCEFVRGGNGLDVVCTADAIELHVSTKLPFRGRFHVRDRWTDPDCGIGSGEAGNGTELVLRIPLGACGMQRQFSLNPRGHFFNAQAVLQFHPTYRTGADRVFPMHCFYRDRSLETTGSGGGEIDWQTVKEHTLRRGKKDRGGTMPCTYRVVEDEMNSIGEAATRAGGGRGGRGKECSLTQLSLGERVLHKWECDHEHFDVYQSILVHSCSLIDATNGSSIPTAESEMLIDEFGCSTEPNLVETPQYVNHMKAFARGVAIRRPENGKTRLRCSLRFCDRLMGECEEMLPPKCNVENGGAEGAVTERRRRMRRRQVGIPVSIRPLDGSGADQQSSIPLLMFDKSHAFGKRKRKFPAVDQRVKAIIGGERPENGANAVATGQRRSMEEKTVDVLTTSSVLKGEETTMTATVDAVGGEESRTTAAVEKKRSLKETEEETDERLNDVTSKADPFQEDMEAQNANGTNNEEITLDSKFLSTLSESEVVVISQELEVRENEGADEREGWCKRAEKTRV